ncbi:MAG TPA: molecular chaperone DnaJ, partial [Leptospiraceae bacterium]|nr:molecular chaperone DnaJ [Leptospiraceae bacterium]
PVTLRNICPECRGGDTHCPVCNGRGSYKSGGMFRLNIDGGLVTGQIIEIRLQGMRPAPLQYYKKSTIRIKVTRAA